MVTKTVRMKKQSTTTGQQTPCRPTSAERHISIIEGSASFETMPVLKQTPFEFSIIKCIRLVVTIGRLTLMRRKVLSGRQRYLHTCPRNLGSG